MRMNVYIQCTEYKPDKNKDITLKIEVRCRTTAFTAKCK